MMLRIKKTRLLMSVDERRKPQITVALEPKWYCLYLITPVIPDVPDLDDIREIKFEELEAIADGGDIAVCDHVPNPHLVVRYAESRGYTIDPLALEVIIGRWELICPVNPRYRYPTT